MKSLLVFVVAAALCTLSATPVGAAEKWDQIGKEKLKDKQGETSFRIGLEDGRYRFIKFKAEGGKVKLDDVVVEFTFGDDKKLGPLGKIRDGEETRPINVGLVLKSSIKKISLKYETNTDDKVTLLVFGKKD
jgi:hypothetical protein